MFKSPYLSNHPCESARHYIPASDSDIKSMLETIKEVNFDALYRHLPEAIKIDFSEFNVPKELNYQRTQKRLKSLSEKNLILPSFIGDGLPSFKSPEIVAQVLQIRNLTTAYTPYQPERSQGTLLSLWIYQCLLSQLTGFEAINASLYDRSSAIFEAIACAGKIKRKGNIALVASNLYPGDIEVLKTMVAETAIEMKFIKTDPKSGQRIALQ